jgi:hypothetical protein
MKYMTLKPDLQSVNTSFIIDLSKNSLLPAPVNIKLGWKGYNCKIRQNNPCLIIVIKGKSH